MNFISKSGQHLQFQISGPAEPQYLAEIEVKHFPSKDVLLCAPSNYQSLLPSVLANFEWNEVSNLTPYQTKIILQFWQKWIPSKSLENS